MKIILAGGGSANDSLLLDVIYARWLGHQGRLLYWPVAMRGIYTFESSYEWITSTFRPLGITNITMWTELAAHQKRELDKFDGVYIGGGNTFSLLHELRESGFDKELQSFARRGKPVYGGSAGAAVLGRDIRTVVHMDVNRVGLTDTAGLDLAGGHAAWVHYETASDELIYSYIQTYKVPVLAISERSGVVIENSNMRSAGYEPAWRLDSSRKFEL